jgi:hypothetical protein
MDEVQQVLILAALQLLDNFIFKQFNHHTRTSLLSVTGTANKCSENYYNLESTENQVVGCGSIVAQ